jgi:hypothetical protein
MGGIEWLLEIALIVLLAATLFYALRLERALGVLKRDRTALEQLVISFNASTRQAKVGIEQLRAAADSDGRQVARQIETGMMLKDDLTFLIERSERAADRLDMLVRTARPPGAEPPRLDLGPIERIPLPPPPPAALAPIAPPARVAPALPDAEPDAESPRLRSQAERDLMKALRLAR